MKRLYIISVIAVLLLAIVACDFHVNLKPNQEEQLV